MPGPDNSNASIPDIPVEVERPQPPADRNESLVWLVAKVVAVVAVGLSLFQLYTAGLTAMTAMVQRSVHLAAILTLTFLLRPAFKGARKDKLSVWFCVDVGLVVLAVFCNLYIVFNLDAIFARQGEWKPLDMWVGIIGVLLVMEACRRVIGNAMALICLIFLLYGYFGPHMPELIIHKGYNVERIATTLWLTTEGVFGLPLGVAATFVFIFVLFGAFLDVSGGGGFFIDMAHALTGRFSGGPAKTSVIASGFMGSVSGSAVGNVVATGTFTIPMMKKVGYRAHVAGAIEAAASTGGQLMPPIMGAGAFLMAEFTNTPYLTIVKVSIVPAIMYYLTVLMFVHFEAQKYGIMGQPKENLPKAWVVLKENFHFIIPLTILVTALLHNVTPMMAGFLAVVTTYLASLLKKSSRMGLAKLLQALEKGGRNAVMVSVACAAAGIIVGMVSLTGMGLKFSSLVLDLSFGIKVLAILLIGAASLVLGMGLPVTASYIVLATLAGPALMDMGVPVLVAHMIVFWYSQDANVTPPVSLASFAAAGVAGANPMQTAFVSWKLAKGLYIIPIIMAYRPLLMNGDMTDVIFTWLSTTAGLVIFAACLERYLFRMATWLETGLMAVAAAGLFWPTWYGDVVGGAALIVVVALQKFHTPAHIPPLPHQAEDYE
ncbi:MAG: TRAP transporter permease [Deltaproteobacteria bacterium]|nr:TRAP transporter permease [Deltaproteobacteria bacterium]